MTTADEFVVFARDIERAACVLDSLSRDLFNGTATEAVIAAALDLHPTVTAAMLPEMVAMVSHDDDNPVRLALELGLCFGARLARANQDNLRL